METTIPENQTDSSSYVASMETEPAPPVVAPALRHFKKGNNSVPFSVAGKRIQFQDLGGNIGLISLDPAKDAEVIAALDAIAKAKRGVAEITGEQADQLKKKLASTRFAPKSRPMLKVWESQPRRANPSAPGNAAAAGKTSPVGNGARGAAPAVVGNGAGAGNPPAPFTPALRRKSDGPFLRPPSTGVFKPEAGLPPPA